ncbi:MAG: hypothetical protein A3G25_03775 [Betaproteobacteria bacterium RIFCSPLOWO2_12_FULL_63_13]|nr:MAG: hypothetical protein A3G25_03775 [Betaproteobacteria bacterium RIFCSPLOWO2_12_FULL_63_13]
MDLPAYAVFLLIVAFGTWVQTTTGFALGLIVVGTTALFDLMPIPKVAMVMSLLGLANALAALRGRTREVRWDVSLLCSAGLIPGLVFGVWLLGELHDDAPRLLKLLLGAFLFLAGGTMMFRPRTHQSASAGWTYTAVGGFAGVLGGLFSAPGPAIVMHLYMQPITVRAIQATLYSIFAVTSFARTCTVGWRGELTAEIGALALISMPVVLACTVLTQRYPLQLNDAQLRRAVFALLAIVGLTLMLG